VAEINNTYAFVQFLEKVLNELHNGHSSLNTNLDISNKLVPSGQDIYVEKEQNKYIIADVRKAPVQRNRIKSRNGSKLI
jgi:carboxyl-terminal processing protease